jgi:S1-C subfamily serine protease
MAANFDEKILRVGDFVFTTGFPLSNEIPVTTSGYVAAADILFYLYPNRPYRYGYLADIQTNHGNSGGPVFSRESLGVVGICLAFERAPVDFADGMPGPALGVGHDARTLGELSANSGIAVVIPSRYITDLLKAHSIGFSTIVVSTAQSETNPPSRDAKPR